MHSQSAGHHIQPKKHTRFAKDRERQLVVSSLTSAVRFAQLYFHPLSHQPARLPEVACASATHAASPTPGDHAHPRLLLQALQQSGCGFSPRVTLRVRIQLGTAATNSSLSSTTNLQRVLEGLYTPSSACVFLAWRYAVNAAFRLQPAASRRQALEAHLISAGAGSAAGAAGQALELPACQPISASAVSAAGAEGQVELPACQPAAADAHPDHGRRVLTTAVPQSNCQALITSSLGLQASEVTSLTCSQGMASEYGLTDQSGGGSAAASNAGVIAGAVIGVVVGLALIAAGVAAAFILHKRRQVRPGRIRCCIKNSVCTPIDDEHPFYAAQQVHALCWTAAAGCLSKNPS